MSIIPLINLYLAPTLSFFQLTDAHAASQQLLYLNRTSITTDGNVAGTGILRRRRRERDEAEKKIRKSAEDELVSAPRVEREVAEKRLVQRFPIGRHVDQLGARRHHLLHGAAEICVGVRRVHLHRNAAVKRSLRLLVDSGDGFFKRG